MLWKSLEIPTNSDSRSAKNVEFDKHFATILFVRNSRQNYEYYLTLLRILHKEPYFELRAVRKCVKLVAIENARQAHVLA